MLSGSVCCGGMLSGSFRSIPEETFPASRKHNGTTLAVRSQTIESRFQVQPTLPTQSVAAARTIQLHMEHTLCKNFNGDGFQCFHCGIRSGHPAETALQKERQRQTA